MDAGKTPALHGRACERISTHPSSSVAPGDRVGYGVGAGVVGAVVGEDVGEAVGEDVGELVLELSRQIMNNGLPSASARDVLSPPLVLKTNGMVGVDQ